MMMKKLMITAAAAALVVSLPAAASAASIGLNAGAGASVGGSGASVGADVGVGADASTGGAASTEGAASIGGAGSAEGAGSTPSSVDVNGVLASFATTKAEVVAIANLEDDTPVKVIGIDAMANANVDAFAKTVADNQTGIAELQAAIAANAAFKSELEAANIAVDTIVAADVAADGGLILYRKI
jgi:hypothetical protein